MKKIAVFAIISAFVFLSGCVKNEPEPQLAEPPEAKPATKTVNVGKLKLRKQKVQEDALKPKKELEQKVEQVKEVPKL